MWEENVRAPSDTNDADAPDEGRRPAQDRANEPIRRGSVPVEQETSGSAERRVGEQAERERRSAELEQSEQRFRSLIENTVDVITVLDADGTIVYESPSIQRLTGYAPEDLVGRNAFDLIHPDDVERIREAFDAVLEQPGTTLRIEFRALHKRGGWRLLEGIGKNLLHNPAVRGVVYNGRDITERKRTEESQRFLSEIGRILADSLEQDGTLQAVADLAVPWLADICVVDLVEEAGRPWRAAIACQVPDAAEWLVEARGTPPSPEDEIFAEVIRTGLPRLISRTGSTWRRTLERSPSYLQLLEHVHPRSVIMAPITARDQTFGVLTLVSTDPLRRYTSVDLDFAAEVARRTALSIENARLYEAALIANEARTEFLALISHELRTPLNTIMGYADLLHDELSGPLTPKQRKHLSRVQDSAQRLLILIDEILTYTRMETGRDRIGSERVELQQLVRRSADLVEPVATERGLDFSVRLPDRRIPLVTDSPRVHQALLHVMTNAVRFTEHGKITVEADVAGETVRIRIRDSGIGISDRHLERIFDPFWQVEETSTRRAGGAGLGLSIARRLMRSIGGDITVESEPGQGSTFTVSVPMHPYAHEDSRA